MRNRRRRWLPLFRTPAVVIALVALPTFAAASSSTIPGPFENLPVVGTRNALMLKLVNGWRPLAIDTGIVVRIREDVLEIEPVHGSSLPTFNGLASARTFDFTGLEWHLRADLRHLHMQNGLETKFRVTHDHKGNYLSIEPADAHLLRFIQRAGGTLYQDSIPYDPIAHAWLRIRHVPNDDTIRWETSPDGRVWTERWRDARRFDIRAVFAEVYGGSSTAIAEPGFVRFSDFGGGPTSVQTD